MPSTAMVNSAKNKKILFDDEGEVVKVERSQEVEAREATSDEDESTNREHKKKSKKGNSGPAEEAGKKWYNVFPEYACNEELKEMKDAEQMELFQLCKSSFETESSTFKKRNPSDARWLQTALHKGTAKDRASAGALLVTSNPLGNLEALATLISFTKLSNKASTEVISILTDLWKEVLLPSNRKLYTIQMRGADWKLVKKNSDLSKEKKRMIYAHWYYENELKDQYFEFLKNVQQSIQTGQENNKNAAIVCASQLLTFAPEKEQMLLTMLINKLGDPMPKIASKALHHLGEVGRKHPNMCAVIVVETEKLLFRNNISDRAQHFALSFLATIAPAGNSDVCTKLVNICFALFKLLVQKGAVNTRTMQAILRCLQKAIANAKPPKGSTEILSKDMLDTIYRLVHLADVSISVQTLGLLLQLISVRSENSDRFYNALYRKLFDLEIAALGVKTGAHLLHIIHRAIHIDTNMPRANAFIKRLLQISMYMPPHLIAGCLVVINKLIRSRKELKTTHESILFSSNSLSNSTSDLEISPVEKNENRHTDKGKKVIEVSDKDTNKYDAYHRVPGFSGAEFALRYELLLLCRHFHPTVQVFAENNLNQKRIDYYGDPLRDFGLPHFLERFAFKNPKKLKDQETQQGINVNKGYVPFGARSKPVKSLTKANCTEEELFIFNFLEQKRKQSFVKSKSAIDENLLVPKSAEVDDDEFDEYLDGFFGKKAKAAAKAEEGTESGADDDDEDIDFLNELGGNRKAKKSTKRKHSDSESEEVDLDFDNNMDDDDDNDDDDDDDKRIDELVDSDESASLKSLSDDESLENEGSENGNDSDDINSMEEESAYSGDTESDKDDDDNPSKAKKQRRSNGKSSEKSFTRKLKESGDMSSLFAAADDFAELLEEAGKNKGHGTSNAISNKDKSSEKQLKWEEKRRSDRKVYTKTKKFGNINKKRKQ